MSDNRKRLKVLRVSPDALLAMASKLSAAEIPEGAEFVEVHYDPYQRMFLIATEHESFPEVREGDLIPALNI